MDKKVSLLIEGMRCASCVREIEETLKGIDGVKDVAVNFLTKKLTVVGDDKVSSKTIQKLVEDLGYRINLRSRGEEVKRQKGQEVKRRKD